MAAEDSDMYIAFVQLDTKEIWQLKACLSIRTRTTFNILATASAQIVDPNSEGDLVRQWFVNVFRMVPELVGSDSTDYLENASVGDGDNEREVIFKTSTIPNAARASATALLRFKMERRTETPAEDGKAEQVIEGREKLRNWTQPDLDDSPAKLDEQEQRRDAAQSKALANAKTTEDSNETEQAPSLTKSQPLRSGVDAGVTSLPPVQRHDRKAYKLWMLDWTQVSIAKALNNEYGTTYKQGQVSRMIRRAKAHADASGLSDHIPDPAKPAKSMDPAKLGLGARTDRRPPRQQPKRESDSD